MRVQLEQREIAIALEEYVANQGINLNGKTVEISFTAGRKETGLVADINIEPVGSLPPLVGDEDNLAEAKQAIKQAASGGSGDTAGQEAAAEEADEAQATTQVGQEAIGATAARASNSLFGTGA